MEGGERARGEHSGGERKSRRRKAKSKKDQEISKAEGTTGEERDR